MHIASAADLLEQPTWNINAILVAQSGCVMTRMPGCPLCPDVENLQGGPVLSVRAQ